MLICAWLNLFYSFFYVAVSALEMWKQEKTTKLEQWSINGVCVGGGNSFWNHHDPRPITYYSDFTSTQQLGGVSLLRHH